MYIYIYIYFYIYTLYFVYFDIHTYIVKYLSIYIYIYLNINICLQEKKHMVPWFNHLELIFVGYLNAGLDKWLLNYWSMMFKGYSSTKSKWYVVSRWYIGAYGTWKVLFLCLSHCMKRWEMEKLSLENVHFLVFLFFFGWDRRYSYFGEIGIASFK